MGSKRKASNKKNKSQKRAIEVPQNKIKTIKIMLLILNMLVVFYTPFVRGLYFEVEQLPAEIFVLISFALFWVMKFLGKDRKFISTPMEYSSMGFMIIYFISIIASVSSRLAISEWLKYCMFFCLFFMITDLAFDVKNRIVVLWTIVAAAMGLSIIGLDSAAGGRIVDMANNLFESLHIPVEFFGLYVQGRIHSTIQYPNALAVYLLVAIFITLALSFISVKRWQRLIAGACSTVLAVTMLLTLSRGVLILVPFMLLVFIAFMPRGYKFRASMLSFNTAMSSAVSLLIGRGAKFLSTNLWLRVLIGVLVYVAASVLFEFIIVWVVEKSKIKLKIKPVFLLVPLVAVIAVLVLLVNIPEQLVLKSKAPENGTQYYMIKSIQLEPKKEYKLEIDAFAMENVEENSLEVRITSKSKRDIMFNTSKRLETISKKNIKDTEKLEIPFTVPQDSSIVVIQFTNRSSESSICIDNARIVSQGDGGNVKKLALSYKFIPNSVRARFSNLFQSKSFISRMLFIQDGLKIFKDHWFIGAGGGAWSILTFSYQSYLYWSTQAHAYFVQVAAETGIIGTLVFIMLIASIIVQFVLERKYKKDMGVNQKILQVTLIVSIATMLTHSMVDFDLSISSVYILLWTLMALFNSSSRHEGLVSDKKEVVAKAKHSLLYRIKSLKPFNVNPVVMAIVSLVVMAIPATLATAAHYENKNTQYISEGNTQRALESINKAVSFDSFNSSYKIKQADQLLSQENISKEDLKLARKLREDAVEIDKYNINVVERAGLMCLKMSEFDRGLQLIDRAIDLRPFAERQWKLKTDACYKIAMAYINNNDVQNAKKYIDQGLEVIKDATIKNEKNMNPFVFNSETFELIEKMFYISEDIDSAQIRRVEEHVFLSINDIDINYDGIPDQWRNLTPNNAEVRIENGFIDAKNITKSAAGAIQTRSFGLEEGKKYKVELILDNDVKEVSYYLINYHNKYQKLEKTGDRTFSAEIDMSSEDINSDGYSVRLRIDKDLVIKSLTVSQIS